MSKRTSAAATNFNSRDLNNLPNGRCQGKEIVSATNKYIDLSDGSRVTTKGNYVSYDYKPSNEPYDDTQTEGDRL